MAGGEGEGEARGGKGALSLREGEKRAEHLSMDCLGGRGNHCWQKRVWAENSSGSEGVTFISVRTCGKFSGSTSLCYRRTGVPRQKDGISRRRKRREEKKDYTGREEGK